MIEFKSLHEKAGLDYAIMHGRRVLVSSIFHRSEQTLRKLGAAITLSSTSVFETTSGHEGYFMGEYSIYITPVRADKEEFFHLFVVNNALGTDTFLTTREKAGSDFYEVLMKKFKFPLIKEWGNELLSEAIRNRMINAGNTGINIIYGVNSERSERVLSGIPLQELVSYDLTYFHENDLKKIIKSLFQQKRICISKMYQKPMDEKMSMDQYFSKYGHTLVSNLESKLSPLCELNGIAKDLVLKEKKLYPQQAALVNGVIELLEKRSNYAILNEGMGLGKTIQAASICEGYANRMYLKKHSEETLEDIYRDYEKVKYRNIVMAPGHLVEKWKTEIESEIPFARAYVITDFSDLVSLRNKGKKRKGKEFYILSKDFAKLSYQEKPVPYQVKRNVPIKLKYCKNCDTTFDPNLQTCPYCKEKLEISTKTSGVGAGLICTECKNLLPAGSKDGESLFFTPKDFAYPTNRNRKCGYCGANLWEPFVKNIDTRVFATAKPRKMRWKRASHYANLNNKEIKSVWVLDKHEKEYFDHVEKSPIQIKDNLVGIRKYAPAQFVKKYMKGYFDFAIFDEAHLYKSGSSAQGNAMHALVKASKKQLALTGTIAGGKADHLFYMLFRLDPERMKSYGWSGVMKFAEEYGCVERQYEVDAYDKRRGTFTRGRMIGAAKTKPGISPRIFTDFLLDHAVFLDMSDMSKYMPQFNEYVVTVPMNDEVYRGYSRVLDDLSAVNKMAVMSQQLQFGLSFPDKPFSSREVFIDPENGDVICKIPDYSHLWKSGNLLPKEEKLLELLKKELADGRCCAVFCEYTASADTNVTERLKSLIEKHLKVKTDILYSATPPPLERERWIREKGESGTKVFIMNPRCVETGMDFIWTKNGIEYNYPTLIFYQLGYSLFTVWQSSRRAYRLIQKKDCKVFYMAYEGTVQAAVISLIAQKQVATSAIQGKFSTEGIAAMAEGVDERVQLATAMAQKDFLSGNKMQEMFDVLDNQTAEKADISKEILMKTLSELIGSEEAEALERQFNPSPEDIMDMFFSGLFASIKTEQENNKKTEKKKKNEKTTTKLPKAVGFDPFDFLQI